MSVRCSDTMEKYGAIHDNSGSDSHTVSVPNGPFGENMSHKQSYSCSTVSLLEALPNESPVP